VQAPSDAAALPKDAAAPSAFDFDAVFLSEYSRIARVVARVIRDRSRAEDLAVEAFWRLWRTPGAQGEAARGWLHRTAVRLALDELRRRARRERYERLLGFGRRPRTPDELFAASEEQGRVRSVLAAIPRRDAELLLLRSDDTSYEELAATLSINSASVGTLLSRARQAFRKEYAKRYGQH
jgi:RNA polymerase sigma-70 factor (ECF subfamily)